MSKHLPWYVISSLLLFVSPLPADEPKPNILLINLDDADVSLTFIDLFQSDQVFFPNIKSMAESGVRFTNFHATTPLCGPSRASLLRGQYASTHGIRSNSFLSKNSRGFDAGMEKYKAKGYLENDLSIWMKNAGYQNFFVGKYLHANVVREVPPGWDEFYHSLGGRYFETSRFVNGSNQRLGEDEYRTTVEGQDVVRLLQSHHDNFANDSRPFFLYWAPFCPHAPSSTETVGMVESQYVDLWNDVELEVDDDFNEDDVTDKPLQLQELIPLRTSDLVRANSEYQNRLRAMKSFDDQLGLILNKLTENGVADNTYLFLTSDNGYMLGHFRMFGKEMPRDRSSQVPMVVVGPGIEAGTADHLCSNVDLAPTIVNLAGGTIPDFVDGKSMNEIMDDPASVDVSTWRTHLLIENWEALITANQTIYATYSAIRTNSEYYVEWSDGSREYYDLALDPLQIQNSFSTLDDFSKDSLAAELRTSKPPIVPLTRKSEPRNRHQGNCVTMRGVAEDDDGISSVKLVIKDTETNLFWDGTQWSESYSRVDATLENLDGTITEWTYKFESAPSETHRRFWFSARAYSSTGGFSTVFSDWFLSDNVLPTAEFTFPLRDAVVPSGTLELRGVASDDIGIRRINLTVFDKATGNTWDPETESWVDRRVLIQANLESPEQPQTNWTFSFDPQGVTSIRVSARAYDSRENISASPDVVYFDVEAD